MSTPRLILASASPRRKMLLEQIGAVPDVIDPADIDENAHKDELPRPYALRMAREKAEKMAAKYRGDFILTGDTVVALGRRILPKAETEAQARYCWSLLPGRRHTILTAVSLVTPAGQIITKVAEAAITFRRMSAAEIAHYLASNEWQGKAGGYGYQGLASAFVRQTQGSYSTILGLPHYEVYNLLKSHGYPF